MDFAGEIICVSVLPPDKTFQQREGSSSCSIIRNVNLAETNAKTLYCLSLYVIIEFSDILFPWENAASLINHCPAESLVSARHPRNCKAENTQSLKTRS